MHRVSVSLIFVLLMGVVCNDVTLASDLDYRNALGWSASGLSYSCDAHDNCSGQGQCVTDSSATRKWRCNCFCGYLDSDCSKTDCSTEGFNWLVDNYAHPWAPGPHNSMRTMIDSGQYFAFQMPIEAGCGGCYTIAVLQNNKQYGFYADHMNTDMKYDVLTYEEAKVLCHEQTHYKRFMTRRQWEYLQKYNTHKFTKTIDASPSYHTYWVDVSRPVVVTISSDEISEERTVSPLSRHRVACVVILNDLY